MTGSQVNQNFLAAFSTGQLKAPTEITKPQQCRWPVTARDQRLGMMWLHDVHAGQLAVGPAAFRHVLADMSPWGTRHSSLAYLFLWVFFNILKYHKYVNSYMVTGFC